MSTDIHAVTEVFDVVDVTLADVKKAKDDGFKWTDVIMFANLWNPVKKAMADANQAVAEAKGMDADDVQVLVGRAVKVTQEVVSIFEPAT